MAFVQQVTAALTSVSITCTVGNYLVVIAQGAGSPPAGVLLSFSDTGSNSYTTIDSANGGSGSFGGACGYAKITTGGTITVTASWSSAPSTSGIVVREYTSWIATSPLDQHAVSVYTTTGSISSPATSATTQAVEDVVGWTAFSAASCSVGAGYGNVGESAVAIGAAGEDLTSASTGAQTATFGSTTLSAYVCGVATFKTLSASGATLLLMGV